MYGKLDENDVIVQLQPNQEDGFIDLPDNAYPGMVYRDGQLQSPPSPNATWNGTEWIAAEVEVITEQKDYKTSPSGKVFEVTVDDDGGLDTQLVEEENA